MHKVTTNMSLLSLIYNYNGRIPLIKLRIAKKKLKF